MSKSRFAKETTKATVTASGRASAAAEPSEKPQSRTPTRTASEKSSDGGLPKNVTLFDIRVVDTKNGSKTKVQFAKDITISFRGEELDLGEYNSLFLKDRSEIERDLEFLVENGYMTEEDANKDADFIEEKGITLKAVLRTQQ